MHEDPGNAAPPVRWRWKWLCAGIALAVLLLGSYCLPATRAWWDRIDVRVFRALNDGLHKNDPVSKLWAYANHRLFDLVPFVITAGFCLAFACRGGRRRFVRRCAEILIAALVVLAAREVIDYGVLESRPSPTRVLDHPHLLSHMFPDIHPKDSSGSSFPADHALFLMMVLGLFWRHGGLRWGLAYLPVVLVFALPRLVSGGHWLTDELVGSAAIAALCVALLYATPLEEFLAPWFARVLRPLLGRFEAAREAGAEAEAARERTR